MKLSIGKISVMGVLLATALLTVSVAQDRPSGDDLENTVDRTVATRQATQKEKDDWAAEKAELTRRYRAARASVDWLEQRKATETGRVEALEAVVVELSRRLAEADRLEESIQDTLTVLLDRLDTSVKRSLPFLPRERRLRLETVASELARPDVTPAEKLRRLLEALQIETGYASSVEIYQDEITVSGQPVFADILRIGRLALFWRTPDGGRVGHFDQAAGSWLELPGREKRNIGLAMEMATRRRPFEIIALPLGRIAP